MSEKMNTYIANRNDEGRTIKIAAYMRSWYRGLDETKLASLACEVAERYFDGYTTTTDAIHDARCIMEYAPDYVNAGCAAVYRADIETECRRAGYANHSFGYYNNVYNSAIRFVCEFIIRCLETVMYVRQGIDVH